MKLIELWQLCRHAAKHPDITSAVARVDVTEDDTAIYVAFPGTGEGASKIGAVVSWLINAVHISVRGRHAGWMSQLMSVYLPLRRRLRKDKLIVVTGYSQGAACALLLADHLERLGFMTEVHAFAAPGPFRLWYRPRIVGAWYRNGGDLVTRLPFVWMLYRHGVERIDIGRKRLLPSIKDHYPHEYEQAIKEL